MSQKRDEYTGRKKKVGNSINCIFLPTRGDDLTNLYNKNASLKI